MSERESAEEFFARTEDSCDMSDERFRLDAEIAQRAAERGEAHGCLIFDANGVSYTCMLCLTEAARYDPYDPPR